MPKEAKIKAAMLTPRQRQVVRLASLGCSVHEIALILDLGTSTVDNHKAAAMKIFGTDKAALLTRLAIAHNISRMTDSLTAEERKLSGRKNDGWN